MKQAKPKSYGEVGRYEASTGMVAKKQPWYRKGLLVIVALLAAELVNLTLWQLGTIPSVPSIFVSEIMSCAISFLVGRFFEVFKR